MIRNLRNLLGTTLYFLDIRSAAPELQSHDVKGFQQFCQYLAKNGKKTPKALDEFRNFLDFTAMKFRGGRKHKIENFVTGRWVLTKTKMGNL